MMGERTVAQEAQFYSFNLERHVPQDHLLRSIDQFVDLSGIREHLRPFYSSTGRPSVGPELMIRMLIIGYCMGNRAASSIRVSSAAVARCSHAARLPAPPAHGAATATASH